MLTPEQFIAKFEELKSMGLAQEIAQDTQMVGTRRILVRVSKATDVLYDSATGTARLIGGPRHNEDVTASWSPKPQPNEDFKRLKKDLTKAFRI